jgi:hypothetical protein
MTSSDSIEAFEARFAAIRYLPDPSASVGQFTREELARWIAAKAAQGTDFSRPYADALRIFPAAWWADALRDVLRSRSTSRGAAHFVKALVEIEPAFFDSAPQELVPWRIGLARTMRALLAHPGVALEGLRRMADDPKETAPWQAVGYALLLDPSAEAYAAVETKLAACAEPERRAAQWDLASFGFEVHEGRLRRLWPELMGHLRFPPGYLTGWRAEREEVARPPGEAIPALGALPFGGVVEGRTPDGHAIPLHHALTLDPVPTGLGITTPRLVLATSLDALLDEGAPHYHRHDPSGAVVTPHRRVGDPDLRKATHPAIRSASVAIVRSPAERRFQSWGESNGEESLFRLGGLPVFVQEPQYPGCIDCQRPMIHLLSLDSGLPLEAPGPHGTLHLDWGSGGVANVFWCDACRVSAWTWACT